MPSNEIAINEQLKLFPRQLCGLYNRRRGPEAPLGYFKDDFGLKWQSLLHPINDMGLRVKEHQKRERNGQGCAQQQLWVCTNCFSSIFQGKGRRLRGKALSTLIEAIRLPIWALIFLQTMCSPPKIYHEINHRLLGLVQRLSEKKLCSAGLLSLLFMQHNN
uniref:Uncharacterized protein n=1 Tax=Micrurus lemniscatus lemniscatus TaxID=129467 RepID=A0A2D4H405_MICLE